MRPAHYRTRPKVDLTPRQREVLELVARGKTNPEIAHALGITLDGAKFHVSEILDRLGVSTREEAAAWWREQHGVRASASRTARWIVGSVVVRLAAGGAAVMVAAVAMLVATGSMYGGGSKSVASASPTASATPDPLATTTTAAVAPTTPTAAASAAHPCVAGDLITAFRVEGGTGMTFMGIALFTPAPCQLKGTLSVRAVSAAGAVPGSPMTLPVNTAINGDVSIPLAALIPDYCQPPTAVTVSLNGSLLATWGKSTGPVTQCEPAAALPEKLIVGPQQRGPGGTLVVDSIPSAPLCDLTTAALALHIIANDDTHGGEGVSASLSGFPTPCQAAYKDVGVALVGSSGNTLAIAGNPAQVDIIAEPQGPADLQAGVNLQWDNWCGAGNVAVRLTIDGRTSAAPVSATPACTDRGSRSELVVEPAL